MSEPAHGTVRRYDRGCSCCRCRAAGARYRDRLPRTEAPTGDEAREHARSHGIPEVRASLRVLMAGLRHG